MNKVLIKDIISFIIVLLTTIMTFFVNVGFGIVYSVLALMYILNYTRKFVDKPAFQQEDNK